MKKFLLFATAWLAFSPITWGMANGLDACYFGDQNNDVLNGIVAIATGPAGPPAMALAGVLGNSDWGRGVFHFRMKPLPTEQRWEIFHRKYPDLSRYYFEHGHEKRDEQCDCDR